MQSGITPRGREASALLSKRSLALASTLALLTVIVSVCGFQHTAGAASSTAELKRTSGESIYDESNAFELADNDIPGWRQITSPGPVARAIHTAVFDPQRREVIIFGGVQSGFQPLGDLWAFSMDSETWEEIIITGDQPTPRWGSAAITDEPRNRMILFFGFADGSSSDEVWALDLGTRGWTRLPSGPSARFDTPVITDGSRAVAYGGFTGFPLTPETTLGDLWEFDLTTDTWRELPTNSGNMPPPTTNAALAFHEGLLYLVGGHDSTSITPGTWRIDLASGQWEQLFPTGEPAAWAHHARAIDEQCGRLLLLGGDDYDEQDVPFLEALEMGANPSYVRLPGEVADVSRHHSAMAIDPATRQLVVFGGYRGGGDQYLGDTWIYTLGPCPAPVSSYKVLVFTKTAGFRHDSIPSAVEAIIKLGAQNSFTVDATDDATAFTDANLAQYKAVVFLSTTGDVFDENQQAVFERYIQAGNGFVGVHAASDTEYDWPWYGELVGAYFANHPEIQPATIRLEDRTHPSTSTLPDEWTRTDEWYNFQINPRNNVQVLASLDETTYSGGTMSDHPIAWYRAYDGGRSWYTAGGHTEESYSEPLFLQHLLGGIKYSAGIE